MLANPTDFIENTVHSETMSHYKSLIDKHQGKSQPKTAEEVRKWFERQRNKPQKSLIRDVASNRKKNTEVLNSEEIEELLSKISDKTPEVSESYWEELLQDVNELLDEDWNYEHSNNMNLWGYYNVGKTRPARPVVRWRSIW